MKALQMNSRRHSQLSLAMFCVASGIALGSSAVSAKQMEIKETSCEAAILQSIGAAVPEKIRNAEVLDTRCKVWPHKPSVTIAAVAYNLGAPEKNSPARDIKVAFAAIDTKTHATIAYDLIDVSEDGGTWFHEGSMKIDTGKYDVKQGNRAFALRLQTAYTPRCADGSSDDYLHMFVLNGQKLSQIVDGVPLYHSEFRGGNPCSDKSHEVILEEVRTSVHLADSGANGYRDLLLTSTVLPEKERQVERLRFNGKSYVPIPKSI
jgi:hypothetical protein